MATDFVRRDIVPGTSTEITLGHSEAATHLRVAGKTLPIILYETPYDVGVVQIYDEAGQPVSFCILSSEAGVYRDESGAWYGYIRTEV